MKMKRFGGAVVAAAMFGLAAFTQPPASADAHPAARGSRRQASSAAAPPSRLSDEAQNTLVAQYCTGCHNDRTKSGGLSLAAFDAATAASNAEVVEKMIRKLRAGMMPPQQARRPEQGIVRSFVDALESQIDRAAALTVNPGWRPFPRLNRAEYRRAVRDLLGLDIDVTAYLPPDTISSGFDTVADVQTFSPALMEGYLRAAGQISRLAVGDRGASPTSVTYKLGRAASQMRQVEGAPVGTRGGISVVHVFPSDGYYVIKLSMHYEPLGGIYGRYSMLTLGITEQVDVSINGERVALVDVRPGLSETDQQNGQNGLELRTPPIHIKAGPQRLAAAFIQRLDGPVDDLIAPLENTLADVSITFGVTALPHLRDLTVLGPSTVTGVSETASRRKVFTCRPTAANEEETCAADIIKRLTAEAFRGTATADDVQDALQFYAQGRSRGDFENGIRMALQSILASPRFLFRLEQAPAALRAAAPARITDQDLASRLSFFLWGTLPDAELVRAAGQGMLRTPAGLERQVKRMLADTRAEALSTRFARQWLRLQDLDQIVPDYLLYPQYDQTLARAMLRETELFFDSIVREDRDVLELLTADYTFVNERLAAHYGLPDVTGSAFRRVSVPEERRGLLGQGSILTLTSVADRTSPVLRGKWVLEVLLGTPPPPPPPNVPALDDSVKSTEGGRLLSTRTRMEEHRRNPACHSCHRTIDPPGLALENFDVTGAWRIKDNEVPVDSVGDLYDGTKMAGPAGLRAALVKHSDMVLRSFTENLLTYALGRRTDYRDMPTVRAIIRGAANSGNRMSAYILGVVNSAAFRMAEAGAPAPTTDVGPR
jgi:Protein of unknown function (DUF1592)/Protein of unknown function (DUF1588)/Protein of unknown function (DUF1587)/Protein of unknown function (DUF1585)/Protein of unknown function (DUF1595)/Planctomycete cytochrome C